MSEGVMRITIGKTGSVIAAFGAAIATSAAAAAVVLSPTQDIWTTSVYSFAPGGGGPGGGLNNDELRVGGWGDTYYSLLKFNLSGAPSTATSATLRLYNMSNSGGTATPMYLDRVTSAWDWTTQPITPQSPDNQRLWWVNRPTATQIGSLPAPTVASYYDIDVTSVYNAWQSGTPNHGIQFRPTNTWNNWNMFASSENATAAWQPQLIVEPAAPPPLFIPRPDIADAIAVPSSAPSIQDLPAPENLWGELQDIALNGRSGFSQTTIQFNGQMGIRLGESLAPVSQTTVGEKRRNAFQRAAADVVETYDQRPAWTKTAAGLISAGLGGINAANVGEIFRETFPAVWALAPLSNHVPEYANLTVEGTSATFAFVTGVVGGGVGAKVAGILAAYEIIEREIVMRGFRTLAGDPPDPDFRLVVVPEFIAVADPPSTGDADLDAYLTELQTSAIEVGAFIAAINKTFDRYSSAYAAGDATAATLQISSLLYYMALAKDSIAVLSSLTARLPSMLVDLGINPNLDISLGLVQMQDWVTEFGLPQGVSEFLLDQGYSIAEIGDIRTEFLGLSLEGTTGDFLTAFANMGLAYSGFERGLAIDEPGTLPLVAGSFLLLASVLIRSARRRSSRPRGLGP
jgi:hypothetical protein